MILQGCSMSGMGALLLPLAVLCYCLPILIASLRGAARTGGLILFNLLLGWTVVGWFVALIWSCTAETKQQVLFRELAMKQIASPSRAASASIFPEQNSIALAAGRLIGRAVHKARSDPEPPPSILN